MSMRWLSGLIGLAVGRRMALVVICVWAVFAAACAPDKSVCEGTACADELDAGERGTVEEPATLREADSGVPEPRAKLCSATPVEGSDRVAPEDRVDGATISLACGLNGRGLQRLSCSAGTWLVLPCQDPDAGGFADSGDAGSAGGCEGTVDSCGVCDGDDRDRDCAGMCFGATAVDCAGACGGTAQLDCAGVCGGNSLSDDCGVCNGFNQSQDCFGVCAGAAVLDCAGVCNGRSVLDCAGECNGSTQVDCAGTCDGRSRRDCAGVCNGSMQVDCAGVCGGGAQYCEGVCGGDGGVDCTGRVYGTN